MCAGTWPGWMAQVQHSAIAPAMPREDDTLAEIDQHPVAHVLGDKAVEIVDRLTDRAIVVADLLAQILGVEPRRQRSRADKIAEHDRQLPPFGVGLNRRRYGSQHRR